MKKRLIISYLILLLLLISFWGFSRYPALNEKETMEGDISLGDSLTFNNLIQKKDGFSFKSIIHGTFNWIYENKQGMIFGILIGSIFLKRFISRPKGFDPRFF